MKKFAMEIVPESEHFTAVFDRIAVMAAKLTRAPVSLVTIRDKRKFFVIGSHGAYLKAFEASWPSGVELMPQKTMSFVRNVHLEPALAGHPLMKAVPYIKSLAHIPVRGQKAEIEATISIINPKMRWPFTADATALLGDLAALIAEVLASAHECLATQSKLSARAHAAGFQDDFANARGGRSLADAGQHFNGGTGDTTGQFLVATMKKRTSIRNRKDVAYVTLRTWVAGIKTYQLQALTIAKARPDPIFVAHVAD